MTTSVSREGNAYADAAPRLLDSLFYAVSHDLRSPLLTVSLSAQLLEHMLGDVATDDSREALGGLRAACDDLERMLSALNALSRASRRASDPIDVAFTALCDGAPEATITLDESTAAELRDALPTEAVPSLEGGVALIRWAIDGLNESPLTALAGSLHLHAGGPVEKLACLEIALDRHQGSVSVTDAQVTVRLPVVGLEQS